MLVSAFDGRQREVGASDERRFPTEVNPYGYKLPIQYELAGLSPDKRFLKIVFSGEAQISRVELEHRK